MEIIVRGQHLKITPAIREYATKKLQRCNKFFPNIQSILVELEVQKTKNKDNAHVCHVTIHLSGSILRGNETDPDMYMAIDKITDKMEVQLKKYNEKKHTRKRGQKMREKGLLKGEEAIKHIETKVVSPVKITFKEKTYTAKPMDPIEAMLQFKVSDHPFFIFVNKITKEINVLYQRDDGKYGLLLNKKEELTNERFKKFLKAIVSEGHKNGGPKIVRTKQITQSFANPREAVKYIDESKEPFCVFRDESCDEIKVIHRKAHKYFLYKVSI